MFVSSLGMLLRFILLVKLVMVRSLVVMVGSSVMKGGGLMMMLHGRMLRRLCHVAFLPTSQ
jgi:hypothetical protein